MSGSRGPTAVVIGLGRSGLACARTLAAEGHRVLAVDSRDSPQLREAAAGLGPGIEVRLGGYSDEVVAGAELVCPSPGVRWDSAVLERARRTGVPVRSELDLVFRRCRARIVGITGTNGKTTTSALAAKVLARSGTATHLGGNIGETVLDRLPQIAADDWLVLELSSFQLESIGTPRCRIAAVLNVTPDHLDRHGTLEAYAALKRRLVEHATQTVVLGFDDPTTRAMAASANAAVRWFGADLGGHDGAARLAERLITVEGGVTRELMPVADVPLHGEHNLANVLAAACIGRAAGLEAESIAAAVRAFRPPAHRLETVADAEGVLWVNDSKATNDEAARRALRSFPDRPIIWIGGGQSKGVAPDALATEVSARARQALLIGATAAELDTALAARGFTARRLCGSLPEAVRTASSLARPGDVVLLAPGYASFDQFASFEERGRAFASLVGEVAGAQPGPAGARAR